MRLYIENPYYSPTTNHPVMVLSLREDNTVDGYHVQFMYDSYYEEPHFICIQGTNTQFPIFEAKWFPDTKELVSYDEWSIDDFDGDNHSAYFTPFKEAIINALDAVQRWQKAQSIDISKLEKKGRCIRWEPG